MRSTLREIEPFVRFADTMKYTLYRPPSITYDSRLIYVLEGEGELTLSGEEHLLKEGALVYFQGGTMYSLRPTPDFRAIAVDFDFSEDFSEDEHFYLPSAPTAEAMALVHPNTEFTDCTALSSPLVLYGMFALRKLLELIAEEMSQKKLFYREKASLYLREVFYELARCTLAGGKRSVTFDKLADYIARNFSKSITNEKIAKEFNYDPCYLNRIMLSCTGLSLHKYILQYRVTEGVKLLFSTDMSLDEIAAACGFYSASHFSNACKGVTGNRPSFYRKGE